MPDNMRAPLVFLAVLVAVESRTAEPSPIVNLAAFAKITASSELAAQKLLAPAVADGRIARQGSNILEFYPSTAPHARSWAVNGEEAKDEGEITFEWKKPVEISQVVYFARTAWLVEECWKEYEVRLDDESEPVAKGSFEKRQGPQRIRFPRAMARKLSMRFLNSFGGPNPGATEILILGDDVTDSQLRAFAPDEPPRTVTVDPISDHTVVWRSPSDDAEDGMPVGNGRFLANVRVDSKGDILVDLAKTPGGDGDAQLLGRVRVRMDPPLRVEGEALRQTLFFQRGATQVACYEQPERPVFSITIDAGQPLLHVQLRSESPVRLAVSGEAEATKNPSSGEGKDRIVWTTPAARCVVIGDSMKADHAGVLRSVSPTRSVDIQAHLLAPDAKPDDVTKADVNQAVRAHLETWKSFWERDGIFFGDLADNKSVDRALVLRRYLSSSSGRGGHPLRRLEASDDAVASGPIARWPAERSEKTLRVALDTMHAYAANLSGTSRFPRFWGADFSRLPAREEPVDTAMRSLASMLVAFDGAKAHVLPGWPEDRSIRFRAEATKGFSVEVDFDDGEIRRLEVFPKLRTGDVVGVGPFERRVRDARAGPFRMPALVSFLGPSWVADKAGMEALATTMKKARFNGYEGNILSSEWCKKHGFYLMCHGASPWIAYELKNEKHVLTYFLSDRKKPHKFYRFARQQKEYEEIAPHQAPEFNTYAQYGGIELLVDQVRPRLLEYYDYHWKRRADLHFHYLEYYRRMSIAAGGIPIFRYCHVHDDPPLKMRQTVSMSLIYGLKGFKWWVGWTMFDIHKVKENEPPPLSDIGKEVAGINTTLAAFSPYLAAARSTFVHHTAPLPVSTKTAPDGFWLQPDGEHIAVGGFSNDAFPRTTFVAVGNRDIGKLREVTLRFAHESKTVEKLDRASGKWQELQMTGKRGERLVRLGIEKGDVELLRFVVSPAASAPRGS